jgi:hypothetical protein
VRGVAGVLVGFVLLLCIGYPLLAASQFIGGAFSTELKYDVQSASLLIQKSVLELLADWDQLSVSLQIELDEDGLKQVLGDAALSIGEWDFTSSIDFLPQQGGFDSWMSSAGLCILGTQLEAVLNVGPSPDQTYVDLGMTHAEDAFMAIASARLETCDLVLTSMAVDLSGISLGCYGTLAASLALTCSGFDDVSVSVQGMELPTPSWLELEIECDFELSAKSVQFSWQTEALPLCPCVSLHMSPDIGGPANSMLFGITVEAIELSATVGGATLRDVTVFDESARSTHLGAEYSDYWELLSLFLEWPACCGSEGEFSADLYFGDGAGVLGVGRWEFSLLLPVSSSLEIGMTTACVHGGLESAGLSIEVSW